MKVRGRILLLLAACSPVSAADPQPEPARGQGRFESVKVERGTLQRVTRVTGRLQHREIVELTPRLTGVVSEVLVREGDRVKQGQELIRLDPRAGELQLGQARAALARVEADLKLAEAKLTQAEAELQRASALRARQAISEAEHNTIKQSHNTERAQLDVKLADREVARLHLRQAEAALDATTLRAPFDGTVLQIAVSRGALVGPAGPRGGLLLLGSLGELEVELQVPEREILAIKPGMDVQLSVAAEPGRQYTARITHIRPVADSRERLFPVVALVPNPEEKLRAGLTVQALLAVGKKDDALLIPAAALAWEPLPEQVVPEVREAYREWRVRLNKDGSPRRIVWVEDKERALVRPLNIRVGGSDGKMTEVIEGLDAGMAVVVGVAGSGVFRP